MSKDRSQKKKPLEGVGILPQRNRLHAAQGEFQLQRSGRRTDPVMPLSRRPCRLANLHRACRWRVDRGRSSGTGEKNSTSVRFASLADHRLSGFRANEKAHRSIPAPRDPCATRAGCTCRWAAWRQSASPSAGFPNRPVRRRTDTRAEQQFPRAQESARRSARTAKRAARVVTPTPAANRLRARTRSSIRVTISVGRRPAYRASRARRMAGNACAAGSTPGFCVVTPTPAERRSSVDTSPFGSWVFSCS